MRIAVIVLNGGSSAGKTSIARRLQELLSPPWLTLGIDDLIGAMPRGAGGEGAGIAIDPDGGVTIGPDFRRLEAAWYQGLAAMARAGAGLIIDEVFLGGAASQERLAAALEGLGVLWIGVHCDAAVAEQREAGRPDRIRGMATSQAELVHRGVRYDVTVDTTATAADECAGVIAAQVTG